MIFLFKKQKVEQKEKEDEQGSLKTEKMAKTKGGRVKKLLQEALPSPAGRRVEPRVDSATKVKAEKEAIKRLKAKVRFAFNPLPHKPIVGSSNFFLFALTIQQQIKI